MGVVVPSSKNTGDAWTANEERVSIKGTMDYLNTRFYKDLDIQEAFAPVTGTAASGPTAYGGGSNFSYAGLNFAAGADNLIDWAFPVPSVWGTNTGNAQIEFYGVMSTTNTVSKEILMKVYIMSFEDGDDILTTNYGTADSLLYEVPLAANEIMYLEIPISNGTVPDDDDHMITLRLERTGSSDTASGYFRFIEGRLAFDLDGS